MSNSSINSTDLKSFLSRFFEKNFEISDSILVISEKFLFQGGEYPGAKNQKELQSTLLYLKDIMESNNLKNLGDLIQYYDKKREKVSTLIEKLEQNDFEESYALNFHRLCSLHTNRTKVEDAFKSSCLYYLQSSEYSSFVFCVPYQYSPKIEDLFLPTHEEERNYMAQVKGNHLGTTTKKCCIPKEKIDEMVSN